MYRDMYKHTKGIVIVIAAVCVALVLLGAAPAALRHRSSVRVSRPAATQTVVAVGDSITKGDFDDAVIGGWVARLASKLQATYPKSSFVVRNAGVDGDTTAGVLARLARDVIAARPQLVIVSIGTNDFDVGIPQGRFAGQLATLVTNLRAVQHPPTIILASMLPIAGITPQRLAAERTYNDTIRRTAAAMKVGYLDLYDQWLALGPDYLRSLRHDGEHPNPIGYELLAGTTMAFLQAGYFDAQGHVTAPRTPPTCSAMVCGS